MAPMFHRLAATSSPFLSLMQVQVLQLFKSVAHLLLTPSLVHQQQVAPSLVEVVLILWWVDRVLILS